MTDTLLEPSTEAALAINDVRDKLAEALRDIAGLRVVTNPAAVTPPCCLVGVPRITRFATTAATPGKVRVTVEFPISLEGVRAADDNSVRWLLRYVLPVMLVLRADEAFPAIDGDTGQLLPVYTLTITKYLTITEEGGS